MYIYQLLVVRQLKIKVLKLFAQILISSSALSNGLKQYADCKAKGENTTYHGTILHQIDSDQNGTNKLYTKIIVLYCSFYRCIA